MALSTNVVHERLADATHKLRVSLSVRYALWGVSISMLLLLVNLLLDSRFHFEALGRWISFLLTIAPLAVGGTLFVWAWRPNISEERIARRIESKSRLRGNILISAVQFDRQLAVNSPLRRALFEEMADPFPKVRWDNVFDIDLLKKLSFGAVGVFIAMVLWAAINPAHFKNSVQRIMMPASEIEPLTSTQIKEIKPGNAKIIHGRDFAVTVQVGGEVIPGTAWIYFREVGSTWQKEAMNREVGGLPLFHFRWNEVRQTMDYYIVAGDAKSAHYRVAVRPATAVSMRKAVLELPAYTHVGKQPVENFTVLQNVLPGSVATINLEFNYPVVDLKAIDDKMQPVPTKQLAKNSWQLQEKVMRNQSITLSYRDEDDLVSSDILQVAIKADEPPKIEVTVPTEGKELVATSTSIIEIKFNSTDNFGLGSVRLFRSTADAETGQLIQEWKDAAGKKSFSGVAQIPMAPFVAKGDERISFNIEAKDQNDVTGPGVVLSRPIVVTLKSTEQAQKQAEDQATKLQKGLEDLIKLQKVNLEESRAVIRTKPIPELALKPLMSRQVQVAEMGRALMVAADTISPKVREQLKSLVTQEMKEAVISLRNAIATTDVASRTKSLSLAIDYEIAIMAKLQGAPEAVANAAEKAQIEDVLSGIDGLLRKQKDLYRETVKASPAQTKMLANRQDTLAEESTKVRKDLELSKQQDRDLADRLQKAAAMFGELKIYEDMLTAAESLQKVAIQPALETEKRVMFNLSKIAEFIDAWKLNKGVENVEKLKQDMATLTAKLQKLEALQKDVVEKSKEMAKRGDIRPEDAATAEEIKKTKELMEQVLEQMMTDAMIWPDVKPYNELRTSINEIFEDVIQADKEEIADNKLKADEVAVQKEDALLQALEKAQKIPQDMEMWLPQKSDTTKWLCENFDKREMPEIPNLPLPDQLDDLVGQLLEEQKNIQDDAKDAASNQALADVPNGWEVADGPQPGFSAQGKSGNTRPNENEQNGRSSGGRTGMSDGEMVGDSTQNLEGSKIDARRTADKFQQGHVKDEDGPTETKATGGGKGGGFGDRLGMEGNSPLRKSNAPHQLAKSAEEVAAQQEKLAKQTAKTVAQAQLLYLKGADGLADAARLMEQSQWALKNGKLGDFMSLNRRIIQRLQASKGEIGSGQVMAMPTGEANMAQDKVLLGGNEGTAPTQYKDQVAEYQRSLSEAK